MNYLQKKKMAMMNSVASGGRLPSEYQEVEWIGSSGTQYIDTGYRPSSDTNIFIDFDTTRSQVDVEIIGARESNRYYEILLYGNTDTLYFQFGTQTPSARIIATGRHTYEIIGGQLFFDDNMVLQSTSSFDRFATRSLFIFALNNGTAQRKIEGNVYACKITENGNLERDFVPCYRKADDVIGLYDLVTQTFFTNSGSGTLTKGNDV